jgi:hypothetical protein
MVHIGILTPICSRGQHLTKKEDVPFFKYLLPSLRKTMEPQYRYTFFVGCDDDDVFYLNHRQWFEDEGIQFSVLSGCQHAPAFAWNQLFEASIHHPDTVDYFFQVGDDVVLEKEWTTPFVNYLRSKKDVGIVGPCDLENYNQRIQSGRQLIIENAFVSRKHYEIFQTFFHQNIKNWYCDNWITGVYQVHGLARIDTSIVCKNNVRDARYAIEGCPLINEWINEDAKKLHVR